MNLSFKPVIVERQAVDTAEEETYENTLRRCQSLVNKMARNRSK